MKNKKFVNCIALILFFCLLLVGCSKEKSIEKDLISDLNEKYSDYLVTNENTNGTYVLNFKDNSYSVNVVVSGEFDPDLFQEICIDTKSWATNYMEEKDVSITLTDIEWRTDDFSWKYNCSFSDLVEGSLYLFTKKDGNIGTNAFNSVPISEISQYTSENSAKDVITLPEGVKPIFTGMDYTDGYFDIYVEIPSTAGWDTLSLDVKKDIVCSAISSTEYLKKNYPDAKEVYITGSESDEIIFYCHIGGDTQFYTSNGVITGTYQISV